MKMEEFSQAVLGAVKEKLDGAFGAQITTNIKNNGRKLTGICISRPGSNIGPCTYLDDGYAAYRRGHMEIHEMAESVWRQLMEHKDDMKDIRVENFLQWDRARRRIYPKLVNAGMNREGLKTVPHRPFLDLAVVYYIEVECAAGDGETASILVQDGHREAWGQEEEGLYQAAAANMRMDKSPYFKSMGEIFKDMGPDGTNPFENGGADVKMYILSNQDRVFGAAEILDRDILQAVSERLADDFIVLPSSLHETVILPSDDAPEYTGLANLVREINTFQVAEEERLSDHVYRYGRDTGILEIVA